MGEERGWFFTFILFTPSRYLAWVSFLTISPYNHQPFSVTIMFLNSRNGWLVGVSSENEQKKNAANLPYCDETTIFRHNNYNNKTSDLVSLFPYPPTVTVVLREFAWKVYKVDRFWGRGHIKSPIFYLVGLNLLLLHSLRPSLLLDWLAESSLCRLLDCLRPGKLELKKKSIWNIKITQNTTLNEKCPRTYTSYRKLMIYYEAYIANFQYNSHKNWILQQGHNIYYKPVLSL